MEKLHELKKKACQALEDIADAKSLNLMNPEDRGLVQGLVEIVKGIDKIEMLEDEAGASMAGGYSGRRHYVRGHYSRGGDESYSMARRRDGQGGGSSYSAAKNEMLDHLESAYASAPDEEHRRMTRELMDRINRA